MLSVYSRHYPPCPSDDINYKRCRRSAKTRIWEKAEEFKRELEAEYEAKQNGNGEAVANTALYIVQLSDLKSSSDPPFSSNSSAVPHHYR